MRLSCASRDVFLESLSLEDSASYVRLANDPSIASQAGGRFKHPYSPQDYAAFLEYAKHRESISAEVHFGVHLVSGELTGAVALLNVDNENRKAEIGFWTGVPYQHKGNTRIALSMLMAFSFLKLRLKRLYARVLSTNVRSINLLESIGFKREGILRSDEFNKGKFSDVVLMAVLESDTYPNSLPQLKILP